MVGDLFPGKFNVSCLCRPEPGNAVVGLLGEYVGVVFVLGSEELLEEADHGGP